ncbi:hypothetical protein ZIOFF_014261 [Zingiber officinale]|uniref:Myb/SANT-like domain-containing protein n=1 Tax=Zingiber officinale TaxID=94328 RepID=A0A8J5LDM7_ZINOF|nr:hypothetical protein ZIOFF_014261 [Zingiber officinale]
MEGRYCFKNDYMVQIHKMVLGKIPSFNKAVIPHIESKIKYLKTKYNPLSEMCMQSGCQWDDVEHKINCEKQWFDEWCLTHPNAVGLRDFKFPYLRKLDVVWGKDRATGLNVEDVVDASMDANWKENEGALLSWFLGSQKISIVIGFADIWIFLYVEFGAIGF